MSIEVQSSKKWTVHLSICYILFTFRLILTDKAQSCLLIKIQLCARHIGTFTGVQRGDEANPDKSQKIWREIQISMVEGLVSMYSVLTIIMCKGSYITLEAFYIHDVTDLASCCIALIVCMLIAMVQISYAPPPSSVVQFIDLGLPPLVYKLLNYLMVIVAITYCLMYQISGKLLHCTTYLCTMTSSKIKGTACSIY